MNDFPANIDAEKSLLGAVLLEARFYDEASERLRAEDFFLDSHRKIFLRMADLARAKKAIDIVTLAEELTRRKETEAVGGIAYIASLTEGLPRRPSIAEYVRIIRDKSLGRQVIAICNRTIARASDQAEDQSVVLNECLRDIEDATLDSPDATDLESIGDYIVSEDPLAKREEGILTGFKQYDAMTSGLHRKELTVVAARTSMGKTSFAGSLAMGMARRGKTVVVFLNEQSKKSFLFRLISAKSKVPLERLRRDSISSIEKWYVDEALKEIKTLSMFWEAKSSHTVPEIRAKCSRLKRTGEDISVAIVDQLNKVNADGLVEKGSRLRTDEIIGKVVMGMKDIAQDLDVPVILMHQLNRETIKNKDSRPSLENLKNSGNIEEHADNVVLLHRKEYYDKDAARGEGEFIIAKARDGPTGICAVRFSGECCSWSDD